MDRVFREWTEFRNLPLSPDDIAGLRKQMQSYSVYGSMLLLPTKVSENAAWCLLNQDGNCDSFRRLLDCVAKHMKVTHIAINKPIPLHTTDCDNDNENIVRAPANFTPIYGDFGAATCQQAPTEEDFALAYWATAKQNGISQSWAPRWTMFSRGNISEKARVLGLESVSLAVEQGRQSGSRCAAVDLYAGIGYFTFSYLKAGVEKVLCWDLNPWSTEGLRRGAAANKWKAVTYNKDCNLHDMAREDSRLLIFNETNERALARISSMRKELPPIRHINCGLLPSSRPSWRIAFEALDKDLGGWVHVHENFGQTEIDIRAEEVRSSFQAFLAMTGNGNSGTAVLETINRVKTYAPGVYHCVLDIYIPPHPMNEPQTPC